MATSPLVPGRLPVAIEDHAYQIEPTGFRRETVQVLRQQADQSAEPGEQSLNPAGLWRRSQESWHHGAGQDFLDGKQGDSPTDPHRFRASKGVDVWTRGQVSLLHPTMKVWSTANTNLHMAVGMLTTVDIFALYVADGNEVYAGALPYSLLNTLALQQGTGWTPTNATIAVVNVTFFSLTATSAAVMSATSPTGTNGMPVEPGREYGFVFQSVFIAGVGAERIPTVRVNWYKANGTASATPSSATFTAAQGDDTTPGAGVSVIAQATAPADAAFASLTISYTTASANGELHWIRTVAFGPYADVSALGSPDAWAYVGVQAGQAAQPVQSLATNGTYVWAALGTSGLHRVDPATTITTADVPAAPASGQISLVGWANGFLLAAGSNGVAAARKNSLWLVSDPLGTPALSLIKTHPDSNFEWIGISSGRSCVYAFGNSGGNGEVYKITFDPNTGTLSTAASPATFLPDGETIHALSFYAGGIIMGTGRGVRLGQADGAGNIDYGPLIETDWPVRCLEPQDRFCWFGWTRYDDDNSGLGRIDLGFLTDNLIPAWASDLMTADSSTGDVVSAVTFAPYGYTANQRPPVRVFSVAGEGVYIEDPTSRVASGQLETGTIRFSTSEPKTARSIDIRHHALPAGAVVSTEMQLESSGSYGSILGLSNTTGSYGPAAPISLGDEEAEAMEFRFTFTRPDPDGTDFTRSPEMTRWTAKVLPTPSTIDETFTIPIWLKPTVKDANDADYPVDIEAEIAYLKGLERSRALVNLQLGDESHTVYIAASQFEGQNWTTGREAMAGKYTIICQTVRG